MELRQGATVSRHHNPHRLVTEEFSWKRGTRVGPEQWRGCRTSREEYRGPSPSHPLPQDRSAQWILCSMPGQGPGDIEVRRSGLQGDASPVGLKTKVPGNNLVGLYFPTSFQVRNVYVICFGQWQENNENFKCQ